MKNCAIVGTQWGDEGKGKIVHFLGEKTASKNTLAAHQIRDFASDKR